MANPFGDQCFAFGQTGPDLYIRFAGLMIGMFVVREYFEWNIINHFPKLGQMRGQEMLADFVYGDPDGHRPVGGQAGHGAGDFVRRPAHIIRKRNKLQAGAGGTQTLRCPIEEANTHLVFQIAQATAHLRLAQPERASPCREASTGRRRIKHSQIIPIHFCMVAYFSIQIYMPGMRKPTLMRSTCSLYAGSETEFMERSRGPMIERESERLYLRGWRPSDFEAYAAYYANEETARYVGGRMTRDKAWRHFAAMVGHWSLKGFGFWAVEEKTSGAFVGCIGLWEPEGWPELELGYWLTTEAQGKGYATEAAVRSRRFAFEEMGATTLVSFIAPENEPSIRVAKRLGARLEKTIDLLDLGTHCVFRHPRPTTP